ncbi:MAG: hypothetical protein ABI836_09335 [Gemmatimonadota bacterium]
MALVTAYLLGAGSAAQAQRPDSISLARLRPTQFVRVETPVMGRVQGRLAGNSDGELRLVNGDEHIIPVKDIQRAWVRGRHTKTGAIVGGLLGAGGGLLLGLLADELCEYCTHSAVVPVTLVGLGIGAGLGAIIGAAIPHWKEVH